MLLHKTDVRVFKEIWFCALSSTSSNSNASNEAKKNLPHTLIYIFSVAQRWAATFTGNRAHRSWRTPIQNAQYTFPAANWTRRATSLLLYSAAHIHRDTHTRTREIGWKPLPWCGCLSGHYSHWCRAVEQRRICSYAHTLIASVERAMSWRPLTQFNVAARVCICVCVCVSVHKRVCALVRFAIIHNFQLFVVLSIEMRRKNLAAISQQIKKQINCEVIDGNETLFYGIRNWIVTQKKKKTIFGVSGFSNLSIPCRLPCHHYVRNAVCQHCDEQMSL